jgi:hypothetical protein
MAVAFCRAPSSNGSWSWPHDIGFRPCIRQSTTYSSVDYFRTDTRTTEMIRAAATYVDRLVKGANAGDLPLTIWDRYYLTVNAKAAAALDLTLPPTLLSPADEVVK